MIIKYIPLHHGTVLFRYLNFIAIHMESTEIVLLLFNISEI